MSTYTPSAVNADEIAARKDKADKEFVHEVQSRFLDIVADANVAKLDGSLDKKALADVAYADLKHRRVVDISTDKDDRRDPAKSSSKEELAQGIFTKMPTGPAADLNRVDAEVREMCLGAIWDVCQTGERGLVQQRLEGDGLILIRGKVWRESITVKDGLYVSTHEEVILREFLAPRLARLKNLTDAIRDDYDLATGRVSALTAPMQEAIDKAMAEATAKLSVKLGSGVSNGQKALGK